MRLTLLRVSTAIGTFLLCTAAGSALVLAQSRTTVVIDRPVQMSGVVLAAGRYEFRTLSTTENVIVIGNREGDRFVHVTPSTRSQSGAVIGIRPGVDAGSLPELANWYPDGGLRGYEFASIATRDAALPAKDFPLLNQRLTVPDQWVSDENQQLLAAERDRNAIRTEDDSNVK
jgi:hypothetical protein